MKTRLLSLLALLALLLMTGTVIPVLAQATPTPTDTRANEIEITGIATALSAGTVTVGGRVIDTTRAEFNDPIAVGALVKVHYSVAANGTLVARELELANDVNDDFGAGDDELEMVGVVDAVTATTITVGGQVIDIAQAELKDAIAVGAVVKIHFSAAANGTLFAREVELAANDDLDDFGDDDRRGRGQDDDRGDDSSGHDLNDDHGNDGPGHDLNDDHGGNDDDDDRSGSSGRGSGGDDDGDHSGHGGGDD